MGPTGIQSTLPLGPPGHPRGPDHRALPGGTSQGPGLWEPVRGAVSGGGPTAGQPADAMPSGRRIAADLWIHSRAKRPGVGRQEGWGRARGLPTRACRAGRRVQSEVSLGPRLSSGV